MPKYRVETDGGVYEVETEDSQTALSSVPGMEKLGGAPPPPPAAPRPAGLRSDAEIAQGGARRNPRTGLMMKPTPRGSGPLGVLDAPVEGMEKVAQGAVQMGAGSSPERKASDGTKIPAKSTGQNVAGGASKVIRGGMEAATPLLPAAGLAAPLRVGAGLAYGAVASKVGSGVASTLGASPEYSDLAGDVAGVVVGGRAAKRASGTSLPELASQAKAAPSIRAAVGNFAERNFLSNDPIALTVKALKPGTNAAQFGENLKTSLPKVASAQDRLGSPKVDPATGNVAEIGKPIENIADAIQATKIAKQRIRAQFEAGRPENTAVDLSPVADAMEASISRKMEIESPSKAAGIRELAGKYRRRFSLDEAEQLLHETNSEMDSYYAKNPVAQRIAKTANPDTALGDAQARSLRSTIYRAIDQFGDGRISREQNQTYGKLLELEEALYKRKNVADRQQENSLSEQMGKWSAAGDVVRGGVTALGGIATMDPARLGSGLAHIGSGLGKYRVATWLKDQNTSDSMLRRAFRNVPSENRPWQPSKGLLTEGSLKMPPVKDASGPIPDRDWLRHRTMTEPKLLPSGTAPFTQGVVVPDIAGQVMSAGKALGARPQLPAPAAPAIPTSQGVRSVPPSEGSGINVTTGPSLDAAFNTAALARFMRPWGNLSESQRQSIIRDYQRGQLSIGAALGREGRTP